MVRDVLDLIYSARQGKKIVSVVDGDVGNAAANFLDKLRNGVGSLASRGLKQCATLFVKVR